MIVEFDIFYLNEEQITLQDSGIDVPFEECHIRTVCFINIDSFTRRKHFPQYTVLSSGGDEFVTNECYEKVKMKIQQAHFLKFN